ncbi:MAG: adenosylcobinamide-phosphate synthase CbiB, partial [Chloroflexota bacterium]
ANGLRHVSTPAYMVVGVYLLKSSFAVRELGREALRVGGSLGRGALGEAQQVLQSLVSRDTSGLSPEMAASAAVESVAENTTDGFVAPWLAFALFGLPGAVAYRAVNTLDSMIGYHGHYEYIGKAAARLDDFLNFIPSRLAALLIVVSACSRGLAAARRAWHLMLRDRGKTGSPNAGWTMSAMAGALGVQLQKVDYYKLGEPLHPIAAADIEDAVRMMRWVAGLSFLFTVTILVLRHGLF